MASAPPRTKASQDGGRTNWDSAWRQHARWLRTVVASRVGESAAIDDVMQQVGLAVAREEQRGAEGVPVAPWLYRVAIRQCLMHRRTAGRRRRLIQRAAESGAANGSAGEPSPLDWLLREERLSAASRALHNLSELDRQMLLLKYTEDWTYRQMAERLGVSVDAVEYRLLRARDRLRKELAQLGMAEVTT